ncbi:B-cell receptor-associated-like protein (macronuclear) [Tetrahymena thermophila SB210]|uniref:B-cell receptor-associated-like protein n=1 Tax=Tetrahymena thermophila (strain SB210) TaxID=312017 RepID=Q22R59_TETTS|nr:B-cell receptor-associated-like protein [Tetrahymena thermophila SB210]EAR88263.1 B-cell receptor-associated-like protein [Tetrahymena thermophila SB210]|eukprot:XP_001008508.1 B-cell receptor-associated-like protein [Tetrahymena thermophila SB210]
MFIITLNQVIFFVALLELAVSVLFIIPLPKGWKPGLLRFVEESPTMKKIMEYHKFIIAIVALQWMYSIKIAADYQEQHLIERETHFNAINQRDLHILEKKFAAEGDIYLNGTLLFVSVFINRLFALLQYYYQIKQMSEIELKVNLSDDTKKILDSLQKESLGAPSQPKSKEQKKND